MIARQRAASRSPSAAPTLLAVPLMARPPVSAPKPVRAPHKGDHSCSGSSQAGAHSSARLIMVETSLPLHPGVALSLRALCVIVPVLLAVPSVAESD